MDTRDSMEHHGNGIFAVDSGYMRRHFDAIHLLVESDHAAIIDTGTARSVPAVLAALDALGVPRANVDYVVLTHVHLDHAGGAGTLMRELPGARLAVHPRGARHMIDPSRLWAGTCAVYGEEQARALYGELVPVAADRVVETGEGALLRFAGRELEFLDAPGHARHHVVVRDAATGGLFCGDTFGISYRETDVDAHPFVIPSSTPVQFDPEELIASIHRILKLDPPAVYLTHYSRREDVPRLGADLLRRIDKYVAIALAHQGSGLEREARIESDLAAFIVGEARTHGVALPDATIRGILDTDIRLNAAGLVSWLDSR